jgi:cytoskeletal protein CcmA (bactofilin family)
MADNSHDFGTVIGPDASFRGELSFDSSAKVLGRIEGSINAKGRIHLADGSTCKATVHAKEIAVEGAIEGNLEATDRVDVKPTGRINGDIVASRMIMAEGASINGHVKIGGDMKAGSRPTAAAEVKPQEKAQAPSQPQPVAAGKR